MSTSLFRKTSVGQIQTDAAAGLEHEELVPGAPPGESVTGLRRSLGTFDLTMIGITNCIKFDIWLVVGIILHLSTATATAIASCIDAEKRPELDRRSHIFTFWPNHQRLSCV